MSKDVQVRFLSPDRGSTPAPFDAFTMFKNLARLRRKPFHQPRQGVDLTNPGQFVKPVWFRIRWPRTSSIDVGDAVDDRFQATPCRRVISSLRCDSYRRRR